MHLSFLLIAVVIVLGLILTGISLWLSTKLFGIKADKTSLSKIVGFESLFLVLIGLISSLTNGGVSILFNLLILIGGVFLWITLLKRFAPTQYSLGRAIGSYIVSYIVATVGAVVTAILVIVFFAQVYKIAGDSMAPAFKANQTVLVYKFEKHPNNNATIVYRNSKGVQALGRVHGTPGQSVAITGGRVEVSGNLQEASSYTLKDNQYYVTVDNAAYNIPPRIIDSSSLVGTIGPKL